MQIVRGATLFGLKINEDRRGALVAFEEATNLPFQFRRFYFIRAPVPDLARGEHACTAQQLIVVASGGMTVDLDDGSKRASVALRPDKNALWLMPGVWVRLRAFEPDTVILVAASQTFAETRYFSTPQPDFANAS